VTVVAATATRAHAWNAGSGGDRTRQFRQARRHSLWVRFQRIAIPTGVVLILGSLVAVTVFNPLRRLSRLPSVAGKIVVSGTKITMQAPRLSGFTQDNRPYEMTADSAAQDITNPAVLELTGVHGKVETKDRGNVTVRAVNGVFETKTEVLTLSDQIVVVFSNGYVGHLSQAVVETKKGRMVSEKPVEWRMADAVINAQRMEVIDSGALVRFDGNVAVVITPPSAASKAGR
jgi:lipopolysaccharide export system protein LptC